MDALKFEELISRPRFARYMIAASNKPKKAQKLYLRNLKVAQALHPLLGLVEIVLRNKLNSVLENHFNDPDWILNQLNGFMADPSLIKTNRQGITVADQWLKQEVIKAKNQLNGAGTPVTVGKIIAEQTFGFWTEFFDRKYYRLLAGRPIQIFTGLPAGYGRQNISQDLNTIRKFRNRINHNEPICFGQNSMLDFTDAEAVYSSIKELLGWMDTDLNELVAEIDSVPNAIKVAKWTIHKWNILDR